MGIFSKLINKNTTPASAPSRADRVSGIPFPAYKGKEPYIFISYAHVDSALVYPIISEFYGSGYNVWYDEGIEPGIEWPEEIANALDRCSLFVVFVSPAATSSPNVRNEINFALTKKDLPFIAIHLTATTLTPGLQLQMGTKQAILKYNLDEDSFRRKYTYSFETVFKRPEKRKPFSPPSPAPENPPRPVTKAEPDPPREKEAPLPDFGGEAGDEWEWLGSKLVRYLGTAREVTLPAKARILCTEAFKDNSAIEEIFVPSGVSEIQAAAFRNCPNLSLVTIEGGYVKAGEGDRPVALACDRLAFRCHRNSLTHKELQSAFPGPLVFFPGEDFEIQHDLLHKYHGDAKEVCLPDAVVIIGGFAFNGCKNLESVVMSDNCGAILDNAFISCPNLRNITLGKNFSSLARKAFIGCPYVRFSYYKNRMPANLDQLFPDQSIVSEVDEG